jgi:molybdopterin adenylyltransferase
VTTARIGIVTISDRASAGVYEDKSGPAIHACLGEILASPWEPVTRVIPDDRALIEETLKNLCDQEQCCLVVTTGGTGPAQRDVTPEATEAVCDKILDGFGELMRQVSLKSVPTAILSRQLAGTRGSALLINLPANPPPSANACLPSFPRCLIAST